MLFSRTLPVKSDPVGNLSYFQTPSVVGCYSVDGRNSTYDNLSNLKYIKHDINSSCKLPLDLNLGHETITRKDKSPNTNEKNHLLRWLRSPLNHIAEGRECTFVCTGRILSNIMLTPYSIRGSIDQGWVICARKSEGTIYLHSYPIVPSGGRTEMRHFWARKFKQHVMTDRPGELADTSKPINENEEFYGIFKSKLLDYNVIYSAKVDAVENSCLINARHLRTCSFVKTKTSPFPVNETEERRFKEKNLLKWWCRNFLVRTDKIVCGFFDHYGISSDIRKFNTHHLPDICKDHWKPQRCLSFLQQFLRFVDTCISASDFHTWVFQWHPCMKDVYGGKLTDYVDYPYMPEWFLNLPTDQ